MHTDILLEFASQCPDADAIAWQGKVYNYSYLDSLFREYVCWLEAKNVTAGSIVSLEADFSPATIASFLALIECGCIVVPLTASMDAHKDEFRGIAEVEGILQVNCVQQLEFERTGRVAAHMLLTQLRALGHPGLIVFTSGSTGPSKAIVHDVIPLVEKFRKRPKKPKRIVTFLLFDHLGGINTLFYALSNGCCIVIVEGRTPHEVARAIEQNRVQVLPASPTFINLLILSEAWKHYDLSSLELVTYGTEPMPGSVLRRFRDLFPGVSLQQTYGLSEVGVLGSRSRSPDSLWVKIGGEGFQCRVVDNVLQIKAKSAMLGYLNASSPFNSDGWLDTGDLVEQDGEFLRILGRKSQIINIGGQKVVPVEVESVLLAMHNVEEVVVAGESHPVTGQIVHACVRLKTEESPEDFRRRMREFCAGRLQKYKIPQKVTLSQRGLHNSRLKKSTHVLEADRDL